MKELFDWLGRLAELARRAPLEGLSYNENLHRLLAPSTVDFNESIVRVIDAQQEAASFGALPGRMSVLAWPDGIGPHDSLGAQAVAAQIGAVLTLAANRRIQVAASDMTLTMEGTTQRTFLPTTSLLDRSLVGPVEGDIRIGFENTLGLLYGLGESDRDVIGAAIELHYTASLLIETEPNAAYALAIAGLERLSRGFGDAPREWEAWEHAKRFDGVFAELNLTNEQATRLRDELLEDRHMRLRQTFAGYVAASLPADFWHLELDDFVPGITMQPDGTSSFSGARPADGTPIARLVPSEPEALRKRLLKSYDARSSYVHAGTRRPAMMATLNQLVKDDFETAGPIEFAGIRAMLRALILDEAKKRSTPAPLPNIVMMHPGNAPTA